MPRRHASARFFLLLLLVGLATAAPAQVSCPQPVARLVSIEGAVRLDRAPAVLDDPVCPGVLIDVGPESRAAVLLVDQNTILRIDQNTRYVVAPAADDAGIVLELLQGIMHFFSNVPRTLRIKTPFVNATIEGTELVVSVDASKSDIRVLDGLVRVANDLGEVLVAAGEAALTPAGEAPVKRVLVRPEDAVQWALYYPPVGNFKNDRIRRASELLAVGRVVEADRLLEEIVDENPEDAAALGLLAMSALVRNRVADAEALAQRAVGSDPGSAVAQTALSYVGQARFDIDAALGAARRAAALDGGSALAWSRVAELEMSLGHVAAAVEAAERATGLDPALSRAWTVLGFTSLSVTRVDDAEAAFERALSIDSADPLPHVGRGLVLIRRGDLEAGRASLEVAVGLDPADSLSRSYLAKAYLDEWREDDGFEQLLAASRLDPRDPTPWLYAALYKQAANRPLEALRDLRRSMALNDNRAVYRSRLLLDEDQAARSASLARIYDTLGFDRAGVAAATASVAVDPANHSAHRFLADSYAATPRHEVARSSELLKSQLLQPLNLNPVQPAFVESGSGFGGDGGSAVSFNEFTPLLLSNGSNLLVSGAAGSNGTWGDEVVVNGLADRFSWSVAQSHVESDGIRVNDDYDHDLYNVFAQVAISPVASVQFEYRWRDTDRGDVARNFDPDAFSPVDRFIVENRVPRLGLRYSPSASSDLLLSWIHSDREEETTQFLGGPMLESTLDSTADDYSAQYLLRRDGWNLVGGFSIVDIDRDERFVFDESFLLGLGGCPTPDCRSEERLTTPVDQDSAYLYVNGEPSASIGWTAGIGYDRVDNEPVSVDRVSPKLGLRWKPAAGTTVRAGYFENLRRSILSRQVLEPTEVAGFNQLFDDFDGTVSKSSAVGVDWAGGSEGREVLAGIELVDRDLAVPLVGPVGAVVEEEQGESELRLYGYLALGTRWSVSGELWFEDFERGDPLGLDPLRRLKTRQLPLSVRYFAPGGFFAAMHFRYLDQEIVERFEGVEARSDDTASLLDAEIGYRLPRRRGLITFEVRNLLDTDFRYQDQNHRSSLPRSTALAPERTLMARAILNF